VLFLNDEEMAILSGDGVKITDLAGREVQREITRVMWNPVMAEKGGYRHFMLKEIYEQPRAIMDTFRGRFSPDTGAIHLEEIGLAQEQIRGLRKIFIVACGTSWHAGLVGKYLFEELAKITTEVDIASEFRYRNPLVARTICLSPSRSPGDRGHARSHARSEETGRDSRRYLQCGGFDRKPGGGWGHLHACRSRDRRGIDQGLYRPTHRALPIRPLSRVASRKLVVG